eukprot:3933495-Rhodomonas_salina.4
MSGQRCTQATGTCPIHAREGDADHRRRALGVLELPRQPASPHVSSRRTSSHPPALPFPLSRGTAVVSRNLRSSKAIADLKPGGSSERASGTSASERALTCLTAIAAASATRVYASCFCCQDLADGGMAG